MKDLPPTPIKTLQLAKEIGIKAGLNYIYIGNVTLEPELPDTHGI